MTGVGAASIRALSELSEPDAGCRRRNTQSFSLLVGGVCLRVHVEGLAFGLREDIKCAVAPNNSPVLVLAHKPGSVRNSKIPDHLPQSSTLSPIASPRLSQSSTNGKRA